LWHCNNFCWKTEWSNQEVTHFSVKIYEKLQPEAIKKRLSYIQIKVLMCVKAVFSFVTNPICPVVRVYIFD